MSSKKKAAAKAAKAVKETEAEAKLAAETAADQSSSS